MSSQGTTQKVVQSMLKMSEDKKTQLAVRFEEHSTWLNDELQKIRLLLGKDNISVAPASEDVSRPKRKSSEVQIVGLSPEQKRNSTDYVELALNAGLPADLNKMKKEQILNEIELRGKTPLTIKSLKKDLVDALKEMLAQEHIATQMAEDNNTSNSMTVNEESITVEASDISADCSDILIDSSRSMDSVEAVSFSESPVDPVGTPFSPNESASAAIPAKLVDMPVADLPAPTATAAPSSRKASLMSDFRNNLSQNKQITEEPVSVEDRAEQEYLARQLRHKEAVLRKSLAAEKSLALEPATISPPESDPMVEVVAVVEVVKDQIVVEPKEEVSVPEVANPQVPVALAISTPVQPEPDTWMEVSSPVRDATPPPPKQPTAPVHVKPPQPPAATTAPVAENTIAVAAPAVQKPSNLMAQSSFLDKPKTVVPSLVAAQKAKDLEELKALKKKELEQAKKAKPVGSSTLSSSTLKSNMTLPTSATGTGLGASKRVVSKPLAGTTNSQSLLHKPTATNANGLKKPTNGNNTLLSGGSSVFNFMQGKKPAAAAPAASATASSRPAAPAAHAPVAAAVAPTVQHAKPQPPSSPQPFQAAKPAPTTPGVSSAKAAATTPAVVTAPTTPVIPPARQVVQVGVCTPPPKMTIAPHQDQYDDDIEEEQYEMEMDDNSDESESDSGTDDEKEKKFIPEWAKGAQLKEALEKQYGLPSQGRPAGPPVDPDSIFSEVQTCSLEEIFGKREGKFGKYSKRTSSAKWEADELTLVEKRRYRNAMGFAATSNTN